MIAEEGLSYITGFGSYMSSESLPGALPKGQNSPKLCPYGLYAEQLSGSAFTVPRPRNLRSWLYRIRPSVQHTKFGLYHSRPLKHDNGINNEISSFIVTPNQLRWSPRPLHIENSAGEAIECDFVDGLEIVAGAGDPSCKEGLCIYNYTANKPMTHRKVEKTKEVRKTNDKQSDEINRAFSSADGDFLIVPQEGSLMITTEFGKMLVRPCEIAVIQRGMKFAVDFPSPPFSSSNSEMGANTNEQKINRPAVRGYVLEIFKGHFELPNLGPIGSNGLANPRDFMTPTASYDHSTEDSEDQYEFINKFCGKLFSSNIQHTPFDVVAWHGNYAPYKYDLKKFCAMNSVTFDHPDPSIFTVLTCPSSEEGTAVADFVIFPPRWLVAENTFRPPYFHRNCMSEYMGMIYGQYDAKEVSKGGRGFEPGGSSLHSCMTAHGPDSGTFFKATSPAASLSPVYLDSGLAFMFETMYLLAVAPQALSSNLIQEDYTECWDKLPKIFDGTLDPWNK